MNVNDLKDKTVAFAASGGLDSCTITRWLSEHDVRVVCMTADIAQPDETDFDQIRQRMLACGAAEFVGLPLQREIAEAGIKAVQALATYEGRYWNTTGLGRQVIVKGMVAEMRRRGIDTMSHGATGRGNDQVRFQIGANMLAPELRVYAPWRDPHFLATFRGRAEMLDYCERHALPIKATRNKPYSTDANLLGLTHEAGLLESLETSSDVVTPGMGVAPSEAPGSAETFTVRFARGWPESINGTMVSAREALSLANEIGGRNAIGMSCHVVENRFVGIKSRGVYEAPGMELLGTCYGLLLQLVLDRRARELHDYLSRVIAKQVYDGFSFDVTSRMAEAALAPLTDLMTGVVSVDLYRGTIGFRSIVDAPHSLYSEADASMEAIGTFDHADSEGLLRVLGLGARAIGVHQPVAPASAK